MFYALYEHVTCDGDSILVTVICDITLTSKSKSKK